MNKSLHSYMKKKYSIYPCMVHRLVRLNDLNIVYIPYISTYSSSFSATTHTHHTYTPPFQLTREPQTILRQGEKVNQWLSRSRKIIKLCERFQCLFLRRFGIFFSTRYSRNSTERRMYPYNSLAYRVGYIVHVHTKYIHTSACRMGGTAAQPQTKASPSACQTRSLTMFPSGASESHQGKVEGRGGKK